MCGNNLITEVVTRLGIKLRKVLKSTWAGRLRAKKNATYHTTGLTRSNRKLRYGRWGRYDSEIQEWEGMKNRE